MEAYELIKEESIEELKSRGMLLEHKKSGARIVVLGNEDDNKVFSIGFRTPPADSTGAAHIVEHTVLCGSREFPAKDPFVELVKGSLNTFLNAMTYSDKTIYPVASCNDKDFQNLMHVYLDAVFYPNIYQREEIFKQEGWHYELEKEEDELIYNGVVYNEMKGVFSSPKQILFRSIQQSLFPDTAYGTESGGDPEFIPDLSYEQFLEFHSRYYHPANSYIYLYGNMDMEEKLEWMDREYLSHFDRIDVDSEIKLQTPFTGVKEYKEFYSLSEEEDCGDKTYLSFNTVIGTSLDRRLYLAFQVLEYALLSSPGAPLKQALLDAGIGRDILSSYDNGILQPVFSIIAKETDEDKKKEFVRVIIDTLEQITRTGLDEKSLRAAINHFEFKYREADFGSYPKGLMYGIQILDSWLYDDNQPFMHIRANDTFEFLKEQIGTGYYEDLIRRYLIDNTHGTVVIVAPRKGYTAEIEEKTARKLADYKKSLSKAEIDKIIEDTRKLRIYQEEPTPKEDLEKIPMLARDDIRREIEPLYNDEKQINGIKTLHHKVYTNGIGYLKLCFHIDGLADKASYAALLSSVLGYADTENYGFNQYANEVNIHTGGIFTDINIYKKSGSSDEYVSCFEVKTKALYREMSKALELIEEMLFRTIIRNEKRLKEIIAESKSRLQMKLTSSGHSAAVTRGMSYISEGSYCSDQMNGIGYYRFLADLEKNFDSRKEEVFTRLIELMNEIFTKEGLLVSFTADEEGYEILEESLTDFISSLNEGGKGLDGQRTRNTEETDPPVRITEASRNEGLKTSGQVQYVARCGNFLNAGFSYTGALRVLKVILSYDYLWSNIRVKGGAYGCMCGFSYDGNSYLVSYRDPNLEATNGIFENTAEYIRNFTVYERDMTKYVIGTISSMDTPLNPAAKGSRSLQAYLCCITEEDLKRERMEVLTADQDSIRALAGQVSALLSSDCICVIGNERKIEDTKELFDNIAPLM